MSVLTTSPPQSLPQAPLNVRQIDLRELTEILIKHFDYRDGFYEVGIQFNITVGRVGTDTMPQGPGAVLAIGGIGISRVDSPNPAALDAAEVNPHKPKRASSKKKA